MSCPKGMEYQECELDILREAVDKAEDKQQKKGTNTKEVNDIMDVVEEFLRKKKLICYGGTAINNILPEADQFYDFSVDVPDYDFYSGDALKDTKELADLYHIK